MKRISVSISLALILSLTTTFSAIGSQECTELLEKDCTSCHYNTRICNKIGKKNKRKWKASVKRMLRYGLKIDKKTQSTIVECLVSLERDNSQFCGGK